MNPQPLPFTLLEGDACLLLGTAIPCQSVDMVYCDPPFCNQQVWKGAAGSFDDRWAWDSRAEAGFQRVATERPALSALLKAFSISPDRLAYLVFMAELVGNIRLTLTKLGTLWLHYDDTMGSYLRLVCDLIFGPHCSFGQVIWKRTTSHARTNGWGRIHDTVACFGRTPAARWRLSRCRGEFTQGDVLDPLDPLRIDGFADDALNSSSSERVSYPTQKPVSLLSRFIRSATLPGGVVLDPTCGSGSALCAAVAVSRRAIGIDLSAEAISVARRRLLAAMPRQLELF